MFLSRGQRKNLIRRALSAQCPNPEYWLTARAFTIARNSSTNVAPDRAVPGVALLTEMALTGILSREDVNG